jgi:hypothetical protein
LYFQGLEPFFPILGNRRCGVSIVSCPRIVKPFRECNAAATPAVDAIRGSVMPQAMNLCIFFRLRGNFMESA